MRRNYLSSLKIRSTRRVLDRAPFSRGTSSFSLRFERMSTLGTGTVPSPVGVIANAGDGGARFKAAKPDLG